MTVSAPAFDGFEPEAIQFLLDLSTHNDRAWFQPRKADFERLLKEPMEALVAALDDRFAARDIPLRADPKRSIFRIYRDTRFSKDKSPYKTNVGASIPWVEGTSGPTTSSTATARTSTSRRGTCSPVAACGRRRSLASTRFAVPWSRSRIGSWPRSRTPRSSRHSGR